KSIAEITDVADTAAAIVRPRKIVARMTSCGMWPNTTAATAATYASTQNNGTPRTPARYSLNRERDRRRSRPPVLRGWEGKLPNQVGHHGMPLTDGARCSG